MLVEGPVVPELVGQLEYHVRAEGLEFLPQQIEVVEDRELLVRVAELVRGRRRTPASVFQSAVFNSDRRSSFSVVGRTASKKREHFEFFPHVIWYV